jgi:hypothetical protein
MGIACNLGRGDGQIAHKSGIRLGAETGMITCPECGQQVPVKPSHWVGNNGWWNIEAHSDISRVVLTTYKVSAQAMAVVALLNSLSDDDQYAVMKEMGWDYY